MGKYASEHELITYGSQLETPPFNGSLKNLYIYFGVAKADKHPIFHLLWLLR